VAFIDAAVRISPKGRTMNRREFLQLTASAAAATAAPAFLNARAWAEASPIADSGATPLKAVKRNLDIKGKPASVFGLVRDNGAPGIALDAGHDFNVALTNELAQPTLIHWHGMTPPWPLDGVPDTPAPLMKPGETRVYKYPVTDPGTYWMHAHTIQEQNLLAAPLIVHAPGDTEEQEAVILLHDFSFTPAEQLLARLKGAGTKPTMNMGAMGMNGMHMGTKPGDMMGHMAGMGGMKPAPNMAAMMGRMDVNDIDYDAYLANDRTLDDPQVVRVSPNDPVRLRIINGAAATAFTIDTGALPGELIAVDGQDIEPLAGTSFPIVEGQRLDIRVRMPKEGGAFPILALREGSTERTGIIFATADATVKKMSPVAGRKGPVVDLGLEGRLTAKQPLPSRKPDRRYAVTLSGTMAGYAWAIEGKGPLVVRQGERVEIAMMNMSMMNHPMHLHGHRFQVVDINGRRVNGALRDTVPVTPMSTVTIAFDATNPGRWAFHCHHLYHMITGMMTYVNYIDAA
jgi:FtsP/CotA-like multicopper oxidase with cupredoxin domain